MDAGRDLGRADRPGQGAVPDPVTGSPPVGSFLDGRFFRPDLLMIGAGGRNTGKTELACRLIARHAPSTPLVAMKVTTVERADGDCPRGGTGCGVCTSLGEPWCLTREERADSPKDTSRLLASGARQVHWLRVLTTALDDGAAALLATVEPGWVSVCESNSLRQVVEPGLFLQVRGASGGQLKPTARAVAHLADRVVVSDGRTFDLPLERISLLAGQWALRREACAVVVADDSERAAAAGAAPVQRLVDALRAQFSQILISTTSPERHAFLGLPMIPPVAADDGRGGGAVLLALAGALPHAQHDWCLVTSITRPGLPAGTVNALFHRTGQADAVVAVARSQGQPPPLGLYHRRVLPAVEAALCAGGGAAALADHCTVRELALDPVADEHRSLRCSSSPAGRAELAPAEAL